ncbi:ARF/SAR superfamily protein [Heterostelium album PN500]|uniref:ARF/SAR superfamily protein n=1 Tax=Heterostelium pallidum (strain ATCC 26659 / Pp 5 / PN500) TaxID=670386 RepID=D3B7Z2_HETP5|nr:ARF/SAR superfamily protein [Heterostelium album PN500]EFA82160.1 ARF/SAR superfamily protein [Heterostelium album PN500]|eukprot:XP_020434277.1 ARF/SAR superfamily protein [Heterostelium album PN500]
MEEEHRDSVDSNINSYDNNNNNDSNNKINYGSLIDSDISLGNDSLSSIKLDENKQQQQQQQQLYYQQHSVSIIDGGGVASIPVTPETINSSSSSSSNLLVDINTPISISPITNSGITSMTNHYNINSNIQNNNNNNINNNTNNSNTDSNSSTPDLLLSNFSPAMTLTSPTSTSTSQLDINNNIDNSNSNSNNDTTDKLVVVVEKKELTFLDTPIEIINYIFLNVGALNMPSLLRVNKFCFRTGMKEGLWSLFVQNDFGIAVSDLTTMVRLNSGARSLYANLYFKRRNSIVPVRSPNPLIRFFLKPISKLPSLFSRKEYKILMYGLDGVGKTTLLYKFARGEFVRTLPTNGYNVEVVEYKSCDFICWDIGYNTSKPVVPVWHHYIQDTQALIFIIDSTDRTRLSQVREELWRMLTDRNVAKILSFKQNDSTDGRVQRVKVLIYANKIDNANNNNNNNNNSSSNNNNNNNSNSNLSGNNSVTNTPPLLHTSNNSINTQPMSTLEITLALSLFNLPKHIIWHVQGCSATSEEGDGLYEGLDWLSSQFEEE